MPHRIVVVSSPVGLHARPAALFTKAAGGSGLAVSIRKGDGPAVPAASILSVLTLNVGHGDEVTIEAEGEGADAVLDDLATLLSRAH
jgi:phosphocarrier protein HPr